MDVNVTAEDVEMARDHWLATIGLLTAMKDGEREVFDSCLRDLISHPVHAALAITNIAQLLIYMVPDDQLASVLRHMGEHAGMATPESVVEFWKEVPDEQ